jgi:hypothetical protein
VSYLEQSQAEIVRPVLLVALEYASGTQRLCSAPFPITAMGQVFEGVGTLGGVDPVRDQPGQGARPLTLSLSGIDPEAVSAALTENYRGRPGYVWVALLDVQHQVIDEPLLVFKGRMDQQTIRLGDTATIAVTMTSRTADWDRPKGLRFTDAAQKARYPLDQGLAYVAQMADRNVVWGR